MPPRPRHRPRYSAPVESPPAITPGSAVTFTLKQALAVAAGILVAGAAYATLMWNQSSTNADVAAIKATITKVTETSAASTKEQDDRRAAMAKEFLASNKEIATKVGDLTTAIAVQQAQAKATSDALVKISDQLQQLNRVAPRR